MELKLKIPKAHNFNLFIEPMANIDPEWMLGRIDKDGKVIENEVEATVDEKKCIIKLHDFFKKPFKELSCLNFIYKLYYGIDEKIIKKALVAKYKEKINSETQFAIVLYEIKEIA